MRTLFTTIAILLFLSSCEPEKFDPEYYATNAKIISTNFVDEKLKSPSTSDYPGECDNVFYLGDSTYMVKSCVDAQNSFGAVIRSNYECKLKFLQGDWADKNNWQLITLNIFNNQ